jgi:hypothetical protein
MNRPVDVAVDTLGEFRIETFEAEDDAYIYSDQPGAHFGGLPDLQAGQIEYWLSNMTYFSYLRFNISSIPANGSIVSARLHIYCNDSLLSTSPCSFYIRQVSGEWNETGITWNCRPSQSPSPSSSLTVWNGTSDVWLCADVSEDVRAWHNGSTANYGLVLPWFSTECSWLQLSSHEASAAFHPVLEVSYFSSEPTLFVSARDKVTQELVDGLSVEVRANGDLVGSGLTNSSGVFVASGWKPVSNIVFNVSASYWKDYSPYASGCASELYDLRFSTNIVPLGGNSTIAYAGESKTFDFRLVSSSRAGVESATVKFYVNGTTIDGATGEENHYNYTASGSTSHYGLVSFTWSVSNNGTYSIRVAFDGADEYLPCEGYVAVTVCTRPYALLFSVSQTEFEPGASLTLNATVLNASTGLKATDANVKVKFFNSTSEGVTASFNESWTGSSGEVLLSINYPNDSKAHAYMAKIVPASQEVNLSQGMSSNPIQLSVSRTTGITLNVSRNATSASHLIQGWLKSNGSGVSSKLVRLKINETEFNLTTSSGGYFFLSRNLQPKDNQSTFYMITASFEGDLPLNATAWTNALDGTPYAACTTIQFGRGL